MIEYVQNNHNTNKYATKKSCWFLRENDHEKFFLVVGSLRSGYPPPSLHLSGSYFFHTFSFGKKGFFTYTSNANKNTGVLRYIYHKLPRFLTSR